MTMKDCLDMSLRSVNVDWTMGPPNSTLTAMFRPKESVAQTTRFGGQVQSAHLRPLPKLAQRPKVAGARRLHGDYQTVTVGPSGWSGCVLSYRP